MATTKKAEILKLKKQIKELINKKTKLELGEFDVDLQKLMVEAAAVGIKSFSWTQYTPYFNDGDECSFEVWCDPDYLTVNDVDEYDSDEDEKPEQTKKWPPFKKRFAKLVNDCDAETLEERFGDHAQITVSLKKGKVNFVIEEYEHE